MLERKKSSSYPQMRLEEKNGASQGTLLGGQRDLLLFPLLLGLSIVSQFAPHIVSSSKSPIVRPPPSLLFQKREREGRILLHES